MTNPSALNANPGRRALRRLDAVEAREKARDAALVEFAHHLACTIAPGDVAASNLCFNIQKISEATAGSAAPPAREDALERVRGLLADMADRNTTRAVSYYCTLAAEALRLLGGAS